MKLILVTFVFLLFSNSLTSQDITKIRFIYGQEGALMPIAASCDISFIAQFGEDLNILTTYDGMFIAQFQDLYSRLSHSDSTFLIDPRIMTVVSYEESIPNDTLYMGEYFGIIKNGNRMQDNDSLLNLVKTKIGWTQYTRNVIEAIYPDGTTSLDELSFRILPPWYRSVPAYVFYFVLMLLGVWYIYRWDDVRVKRKKQQAVVEKDKELHEMEKEFEAEKSRREKQIMQLEKEKLEYDLQHKSQEMANLMINFVRKNEMLTEIKSEIFKVASSLKGEGAREGKQLLLIINGKIDSNIQSDEVLKRIEDQFDLIHNNFMKRLHARHPDLSDNERMMCAYLKMNLSTKEIAPLLNISVRGVETIRYRLRKKFGLEREDSLTDYLNNKL